MKLWFIPIIFSLTQIGCSNVSRENNLKIQSIPEQSSIVYANAEHRMMMISDPKSFRRFCAEPAPDASISITDSESEKVDVLGKEEKMGDTTSEVASSLGGRNSTVLLARDILYRACELLANTNANFMQSREIFLQSLKTIEALGAESQATISSKIGTTSTINENLGINKSSTNTDAANLGNSQPTNESSSDDNRTPASN